MSDPTYRDPTYRIDVEHRPGDPRNSQWAATVIRLSDEFPCEVVLRGSSLEASVAAREWVAAHNTQQPGFSVYVDDDGRPVEGHSVKA